MDIKEIAKNASNAYLKTMNTNCELKNNVLRLIAKKLKENEKEIFSANLTDLKNAQKLLNL